MKIKNTIGLLLITTTLTGGVFMLSSCSLMEKLVLGYSNEFSVNATNKNLSITGPYNQIEEQFILPTRLGNPITFGYLNTMYSKGNIGQMQGNNKGIIYNKTPLHYITNFSINYTSETPLLIAFGNYENPNKSFQEINPNEEIIVNDSSAYFALKTNERYATIKSFKIEFNCNNGEFIDPQPGTSEDSSSENKPNPGFKTATLSVNSLTSGRIPTSYASSGVEFSVNDINFFGNYITNDYAGGYAIDHIFLKEKEKGMITNLNPINDLSSISFNGLVNDTSLNIYGSNTFNDNWEKVAYSSSKINFNKPYKYFKITSKEQNFGFNELNITYKSTSASNNTVYNYTNAVPLTTRASADALISVSSEHFVNTSEWVNKGYAKDINEAKKEASTQNKQGSQSGFEGFVDYQLEFNPSVAISNDKISYRVADMHYGDNGDSFRINMLDPNKTGPVIYKDCAYTFYDDVAAYIIAFGDVPINMRYKKSDSGQKNAIKDFGIDGRANYDFYNNSSKGHPYETEVALHRYFFNPSQNNNDYYYKYFENDLGASVGNNEPYQQTTKFKETAANPYNNGKKITRGTLRFVWTNSFTDSPHSETATASIKNPYDRNVFFTNNHYNDFQQYLNYYGGWSLKFGNTTNGNPWGEYGSNGHLKYSPEVILTSLSELQK